MAKCFHIKIPESTIHSWIKNYSKTSTFNRLRDQAIKLFSGEMVFSQKLQHKQIYNFKLHRAKLALQAKEISNKKFQLLKNYLRKISTDELPHHIFTIPNEELEKRASQLKPQFLKITKLQKKNVANKLAELGLMLVKTNCERHEAPKIDRYPFHELFLYIF